MNKLVETIETIKPHLKEALECYFDVEEIQDGFNILNAYSNNFNGVLSHDVQLKTEALLLWKVETSELHLVFKTQVIGVYGRPKHHIMFSDDPIRLDRGKPIVQQVYDIVLNYVNTVNHDHPFNILPGYDDADKNGFIFLTSKPVEFFDYRKFDEPKYDIKLRADLFYLSKHFFIHQNDFSDFHFDVFAGGFYSQLCWLTTLFNTHVPVEIHYPDKFPVVATADAEVYYPLFNNAVLFPLAKVRTIERNVGSKKKRYVDWYNLFNEVLWLHYYRNNGYQYPDIGTITVGEYLERALNHYIREQLGVLGDLFTQVKYLKGEVNGIALISPATRREMSSSDETHGPLNNVIHHLSNMVDSYAAYANKLPNRRTYRVYDKNDDLFILNEEKGYFFVNIGPLDDRLFCEEEFFEYPLDRAQRGGNVFELMRNLSLVNLVFTLVSIAVNRVQKVVSTSGEGYIPSQVVIDELYNDSVNDMDKEKIDYTRPVIKLINEVLMQRWCPTSHAIYLVGGDINLPKAKRITLVIDATEELTYPLATVDFNDEEECYHLTCNDETYRIESLKELTEVLSVIVKYIEYTFIIFPNRSLDKNPFLFRNDKYATGGDSKNYISASFAMSTINIADLIRDTLNKDEK